MPFRLMPRWQLPERDATPESVYLARRTLLRGLVGSMGALSAGCYLSVDGAEGGEDAVCGDATYPVPTSRNPLYTVPERCLTPEERISRFNNFYEFTPAKAEVWKRVGGFQINPWAVEVSGLVRHGGIFDLDDLVRLFPPEERVYRFRCVEAWAMTVPWRGFSFRRLAERVEPLSDARYVRFVTASQPDAMVGLANSPENPWPYHEGLRLDEALHELTFLATGLYGNDLPKQNGAPLRLVTPWKYGYKSIKSIVQIEFVAEPPPTFWNTLWPEAYDFESNVNPERAHPNWSQRFEQLIESGKTVPTQPYNGYGEFVASLYR